MVKRRTRPNQAPAPERGKESGFYSSAKMRAVAALKPEVAESVLEQAARFEWDTEDLIAAVADITGASRPDE